MSDIKFQSWIRNNFKREEDVCIVLQEKKLVKYLQGVTMHNVR